MSSSSPSECGSQSSESPRNIENEAKGITENLLPQKSNSRYNDCYRAFIAWKLANKTTSFSEDVFLVYFNEMSKKIKPSTLWSRWSMLKTTILLHHEINLNDYKRLKTLLKNLSKGFHQKKAKVFSWAEIMKFINEAPDHIYLATKVILIFGICGALRSIEFCTINRSDVEDTGTQLVGTIRDTKNYYPRSFVIGANFYSIVKRYMDGKPEDIDTPRFFINFQKGKCTRQVIGKNKISEIPKTIALYLNLPNIENYTGHCFRRTSATLLANSGANLTTLKQHGGWKSSCVAEGYIEHSLGNKQKIFNNIINSEPSTSTGIQRTTLPRNQEISAATSFPSCSKDDSGNIRNSLSKLPLQPIENVEFTEIPMKKLKQRDDSKKKNDINSGNETEPLNFEHSVIKIKNSKIRRIVINCCQCKEKKENECNG